VTTKDKTGDQLMASIRKTKTESATTGGEPAGTPEAAATTRKKAAAKAKPAAARQPRSTAKKKVVAKPGTKKAAPAVKGSAYQSSRRVWPD
jgi:hypothetical protein